LAKSARDQFCGVAAAGAVKPRMNISLSFRRMAQAASTGLPIEILVWDACLSAIWLAP